VNVAFLNAAVQFLPGDSEDDHAQVWFE